MTELESLGSTSYAITDAILDEESAPGNLAEFLLLLVRETKDYARLGQGAFALSCIDKFDIGYEAFNYCLGEHALTDQQREQLGARLQYVKRTEVIRWAHERITRDIRSDAYYNSFLLKHSDFIFEHLASEMTSYLLVPNRGPYKYNIDSLMHVAEKYSKPAPFVRRIREWIYDGYFDGRTRRDFQELDPIMGAGMSVHLLKRNRSNAT